MGSTIQRAIARPEAGAAVAAARRVGAVEALEDALGLGGGIPGLRRRPRCERCRRPRATQPHAAVGGRVAHRVLEQVRDHLVHALGVARHGDRPAGSMLTPQRRRDLAGSHAPVAYRARAAGARRTPRALERQPPSRAARGPAAAPPAARAARSAPARCAASRRPAGSTPSTRFSSSACSAPIGVRSSCETLATRSRRIRSTSASSAAIALNARASSPTSSREVAVTRRP